MVALSWSCPVMRHSAKPNACVKLFCWGLSLSIPTLRVSCNTAVLSKNFWLDTTITWQCPSMPLTFQSSLQVDVGY